MVQAKLPTDLGLYENTEDPIDSGDIQLIGQSLTLVDCDTANWTIRGVRCLPFNSGGTYEPQIGDTLVGVTSGASAFIQYIHVISGNWEVGDAAGKFYFFSITGSFQNGEILKVGINPDVATATGADAATGITQTLETVDYRQGAGSVKFTIPAGMMITATRNFSAQDLSVYDFIKVMAKTSGAADSQNEKFWYGEFYWNEEWDLQAFVETWKDHTWDISGEPAVSRNAVAWFAIQAFNAGASAINLWVDFVRAAKKSQVKFTLPDGVFSLFPKIYAGFYFGNGVDNRQINIPRKGAPCAVLIQRAAGTTSNAAVWRHKYNVSGESFQIEGGALLIDGIKIFGDCFFTLGTQARVNNSGDHFLYLAFFED